MNQILITKKLYVTPELKKKKKAYKIYFIISIIVVIVLASFYIYSEVVRMQEESVAQDILLNMEVEEDDLLADGDILIVSLKENSTDSAEAGVTSSGEGQHNTSTGTNKKVVKTSSGKEYTTVATVRIPEIEVEYPVLLPEEQTTESMEEALKISPTKFWGPEPNQVGNFCIVAHNYRNEKFFSKVPTLENGAIIELEDLSGKTIKYVVYDKYTVEPTDVSCTTQLTNGRKEVTLITCTDDSKLRVIVKAKEKR